MHIHEQFVAVRDEGVCDFEKSDVCGGKTVVVFPDGRRNLSPYSPYQMRHGCTWRDISGEMSALRALTGPDAMEIATSLHDQVAAAVPGVKFSVDSFTRRRDKPISFQAAQGTLTVRGGFPLVMAGVDPEVRRIVDAFAAARKVVDAEIATWRRTTIDACCVAVGAGLSGLDGDAFFQRIARDPTKVTGVVGDGDGMEAVASMATHEVVFGEGVVFRVTGRTVVATAKTREYTFDGCRLIVKNAPQVPETLLATMKGRPLDDLIAIPGLDGSELVIDRVKAVQAGKKLQMTVHLVPSPLRMDAARELYDRIQARSVQPVD